MPRLKPEEKIKQLEQQKKEIEAQKRQLIAKETAKKRKARARRLIQIGAIALKYFDLPDMIEPKDFQEYIYSCPAEKKTDKSL
jgi:hypothetical protein